MLILITLLVSCKSTVKNNNPLLEVTPPSPIVNEVNVITYDSSTGLVSMPLYYWIDLMEYITTVEEMKKIN